MAPPEPQERRPVDAAEVAAFARWFDDAYERLVLKAERAVPVTPAPDAEDAARGVIARACMEYEAAFVPAQFSLDARERKNEILALLVMKLARVYGHAFPSRDAARDTTTRLMRQTLDEGKVKTALGSAGAFLTPLLSPDVGKRAWRIFRRVPFWAKTIVAGGVLTALIAAPMVTPLSLGVVAREEFRATAARNEKVGAGSANALPPGDGSVTR